MLSAEIKNDVEQRRLAWRCRRGLLELDIVLQRFVSGSFTSLSQPELTALDALLALPDNDFWALLSTESVPVVDIETLSIIKKIQLMHQTQ